MIVEFYDPHPGLMGCPIPLPEKVRKFAAAISGKKIEIMDVVQRLQHISGGYDYLTVANNYIGLASDFRMVHGLHLPTHCWRVIRFKPDIDETELHRYPKWPTPNQTQNQK